MTTLSARQRGVSVARRGADYFGMSGGTEFVAAASLFALMIVFKLVNGMSYRFARGLSGGN